MAAVGSSVSVLRRLAVSRRLTRVLIGLAVLVVVIDLSVAAVQAGRFVGIGWRLHDRPSQLPRDNDLDPLAYFLPTAALAGARRVIPSGATYAIVVGDNPPVGDPELIRIVFRMWLVPRSYTDDPADAQWVIAYHESSEDVGVPYVSETGVAPAVNVLKVRR
jgi:hypothetical protein